MDANQDLNHCVFNSQVRSTSDQGQSVLEFLMMLPVLIGMALILIRVNTAIQVSIVSQQYARAQALYLAYNSPFYPEKSKQAIQLTRGMNQLVVGVSGNLATPSGEYEPEAMVATVSRKGQVGGSDGEKEEPKLRSNVRIRDTVTLCTQNLLLGVGGRGGGRAILPIGGLSILNEGAGLPSSMGNSYCGSSLKYE